MLRLVRKATSMRAAQWRLTNFINVAFMLIADIDPPKPARSPQGSATINDHRLTILACWVPGHNNARIEALNGIFQAAKCRTIEYRKDNTFISMIYLLAAPIQNLIKPT
jgi:hypothetical protein